MRRDDRSRGWHRFRMADLQKFERACRVFLAQLLAAYGPGAPDLLCSDRGRTRVVGAGTAEQ
jgi:hypothetical protein